MSTKPNKKKRRRAAAVRRKLDQRREQLREQREMEARQKKSQGAGKTVKVNEEIPMPPRNGPCPLHPEHKFKHCPHGCKRKFELHRSRAAGDVNVMVVDDDDPRKGKIGREIDPGVNVFQELTPFLE